MSQYEVPRRINMQTMTPEEKEILELVWKVEALGAHPHLTRAVVLLSDARSALADFIDGVPVPETSGGA